MEGPPVAVPPQKPKQPIQITKEERLEVENFALKLENIAYRKKVIQDAIADINNEEQATKMGLAKFKESLGQKYGMDSLKLKIRRDGTLSEEAQS
jgi:hypothetical protein